MRALRRRCGAPRELGFARAPATTRLSAATGSSRTSRIEEDVSVLPSSYTQSSMGPVCVCATTDASVSARNVEALRIGMMNETTAGWSRASAGSAMRARFASKRSIRLPSSSAPESLHSLSSSLGRTECVSPSLHVREQEFRWADARPHRRVNERQPTPALGTSRGRIGGQGHTPQYVDAPCAAQHNGPPTSHRSRTNMQTLSHQS